MGWFHAAYAAGELDLDGVLDGAACPMPKKKVQVPPCPKELTGVEVIYHMCEKEQWEEAVKEKGAYFPPTFHQDGKFTRASVFKEGLIDTANHFYKETSKGDWICLAVNLKLLLDMGIVVLPQDEQEAAAAAAVEDGKEEKDESPAPVQCLQLYSGISTIIPGLVMNIYPMKRGGCGTFLELEDPISYSCSSKRGSSKSPKRASSPKPKNTKIAGVGEVPSAKSSSKAKAKSEKPAEEKKSKAKPEQPEEEKKSKSKSWFGSSKKK